MTHPEEDIDALNAINARLGSLGRSTAGVRARPDFTARVMGAVAEAEPRGIWGDILAPARRVIPVAAALAVVAMGWAIQAEGAFDDALAGSYDSDSSEIAW